MSTVSEQVGSRIRTCRKARGMTLQQLADAIHKSRASVSKYESGEITLDIETLYDIAAVLSVNLDQLIAYQPPAPPVEQPGFSGPFFRARRLYFYFYDGRHKRLKDGVIDVRQREEQPGEFEASLRITHQTASGRSSEVYYTGRVVYSDMLIRFSFVNRYNSLEEDLLYIFNPLERCDMTHGLLCGISSTDLMPCAFKCLVTLTPQVHTEALRSQLMLTKSDLQRWQRMNMLLVDNRGSDLRI